MLVDTALGMHKVLVIFGTRPEAIKLFPVVRALGRTPGIAVRTCVTAQHRGLLDQVLSIAGLTPDIDLDLMEPGQSLDRLTARLLMALGEVMDAERPDRVLVQGDTTTAMVAALAAYYRRVPVSHVEAGLRSGDIGAPWPEEVNRRIVTPIADQHFAPTETAAAALRRENVDAATIHVTGNTVIDALHWTRGRIAADPSLAAGLDGVAARFAGRKLILVTAHRREAFGDGMAGIARAIGRIADRPDVAVLFPVHPNPNVMAVMAAVLGTRANVARVDPLDYPHFIRALGLAHIALSDSGGVQEEAPALGTPVLVMRDTTERPEGIAAGTARLVGTSEDRIVSEVFTLLDDPAAYSAMARAHNPFGDGQAAARIARVVADGFGKAMAGARPAAPRRDLINTVAAGRRQPFQRDPVSLMLKSLFRKSSPVSPPPRVPDDVRVYAIGDIHGRSDLFDDLLVRVVADDAARGPKRLILVLLGDLIDRGPDSAGVVERAIALDATSDETHFIGGNHEELLLHAIEGDREALKLFSRVGGRETILSYGVPEADYDRADFDELAELLASHVPQTHVDFLTRMEDVVEIGDYAFVHAGIRPGVPLADQQRGHLRWIRSEFLDHRGSHPRFIVHGHTITESIDERPNRLGIDTGAYASGRLTAVGLEGAERWFIQTG